METKMKTCRQCGEIKPATKEHFRPYYNKKSNAFYTNCLTCEKLNSRHKYLVKKQKADNLNDAEAQELGKIEDLYDLLRAEGLKPPAKRDETVPALSLDDMIAERKKRAEERAKQPIVDIPVELHEWLTKDLSDFEPDYLQDEIVDALTKKYRPQIGVDQLNNYKPIYDDKYRDVLNQIIKRFDEYEDNYDY